MSQQPATPTQLHASQIEQIVRKVLASLEIPSSVGSTHVSATVLSLDVLRSLPKDIKQISVGENTLVTPAAKDYLKEKGIAWTKTTAQTPVAGNTSGIVVSDSKNIDVSSSKRLFVTGSVLWLRNLEKQLCPKATLVDQIQMDDASAIRSVAQAIRNGASNAVAIVKAPHATLWQAARDEALRPAIISQWSDLEEVFREVPTNLLIVPALRWNIAGSANITRKFLDHLKANR